MLKNFLRLVFLIVAILLLFSVMKGNCQSMSTQERLLTEISVDVKYIKTNIEELKIDFKGIQAELTKLDKRVTNVESRTTNLENVICNLENINKWFLSILAAIIGGLVLFQYKRASNFKGNNGKKAD